jgi:hypothetical protein
MAKKRIKQVTEPAVNNTAPTPIDPEKSLKLIAAIANRLLEEGTWVNVAKVALSGTGDNING